MMKILINKELIQEIISELKKTQNQRYSKNREELIKNLTYLNDERTKLWNKEEVKRLQKLIK